ncbi:TIGR01777 family oxidoreductase [Pengzhenrongella sicca]|uniref:TIGR01777 family oxidoreductase n=1 Tax=Pengzhenrongella sicca TaxID=2819238 RepID=A0A8A4ZAF2_9MICO|nr:TIGR01777 family oxidoreductase [Pengzhenrongella sicca]QTE28401.1 TIGR01777 family oxidoreductase [Pengzhenrongella sicca]
MRVVIAGSSGLVGTALVTFLSAQGHDVRRLVRRAPASPDEIRWDPDTGRLDPSDLEGADAVVNLAGAGVGDHRLTATYKRVVIDSRTRTTTLLAQTIAGLATPPEVLLQASGIGAYGLLAGRGDEVLDESTALGDTFFAGVVRTWEGCAAPAEDAGVRVAYLRSGIVLAPRGGALGRLLPLVRAGVGGPLGSGRQYWSWITLTDEVAAIAHLLTAPVAGPVNFTSPEPATNADLTAALARAVHRPAVIKVPAFAVRLAIGEFSQEVLGSVRAVPRALSASGFTWTHPGIADAARWVTARPPQ